jgi:hypothetical protein
MVREVQCRVGRYKEVNQFIPPWVPIEVNDPTVAHRQLTALEEQAKRHVEASPWPVGAAPARAFG